VKKLKTPTDKFGEVRDGFDVICTTYRLTEHYHYWTKNNPMNVQLVPEPFVEISEEMAQERGILGGDRVKVEVRGASILRSDGDKAHQGDADHGKKPIRLESRFTGVIAGSRKMEGNREDAGEHAFADGDRSNAYTPEFKGSL